MRSVVVMLIVAAMAAVIAGCPKDAKVGNGGSEGNSKGGIWHIETVDSEGIVGGYTSIALDSLDSPHISYWDGTNGDLKYAYYK